jgi:antitoxin component YwqK of YwqJK toxin-antitoxin module
MPSLRVLPLICAGLMLGSCSTQKYVAASHPNGRPEVEIYMKGKGEDAVKVMEKVYYSNGKLEYVGRFQNGVEHGEWLYYYEDGTRKYVENWKNGVEHGVHYDYSPDGQIFRELHYDEGRIVKEIDRSRH